MIEIHSVQNGPCDLEVQQKDKEVFTVKIKGDAQEKRLCWACLKRLAMMSFRKKIGSA